MGDCVLGNMQNENEKHLGREVKTEEEMTQGGRESREAEKIQHKCEQKAVNTDERRRELEQVNLTISMAKEA